MNPVFPEDVHALVEDWLKKRPEHRVTQVFFDAPQTWHLVLAVWLDEVQVGLFDADESPVALARSAFWSDELLRCEQGQGRHPLTQFLCQQTSFNTLSALGWHQAVTAWRQPKDRPADSAGTVQQLTPLAEQLTLMAKGWGANIHADHFVLDLGKAWLQADAGGLMNLPKPLMAMLDQSQDDDRASHTPTSNIRQAFIAQLQKTAAPASPNRWRNIETWLCRHHLKQLNQHQSPQPPSGLHLLWSSWRAARSQPSS